MKDQPTEQRKASTNEPYAAYAKPPRNSRLLYWLTIVPVVTVVTFLILSSIAQPGTRLHNFAEPMASVSFFVGILIFAVATAQGSRSGAKAIGRLPTIKDFILSRGWQFEGTGSNTQLSTELLALGWDEFSELQRFEGSYQHHAFIGNIIQNDDGIARRLCLHFALQKVYPFMIVRRRNDAGKLAHQPIGGYVHGAELLQLEGDFSDYFDVSILAGTQQDVLAFFTPDFMDELRNTLYDFSFELGAHHLYIYDTTSSPFVFNANTQSLHNVLGGADVLFKQLHDVQPTWNAASPMGEINKLRQAVKQVRSKLVDNASNATDSKQGEWQVPGLAGTINGDDDDEPKQ